MPSFQKHLHFASLARGIEHEKTPVGRQPRTDGRVKDLFRSTVLQAFFAVGQYRRARTGSYLCGIAARSDARHRYGRCSRSRLAGRNLGCGLHGRGPRHRRWVRDHFFWSFPQRNSTDVLVFLASSRSNGPCRRVLLPCLSIMRKKTSSGAVPAVPKLSGKPRLSLSAGKGCTGMRSNLLLFFLLKMHHKIFRCI